MHMGAVLSSNLKQVSSVALVAFPTVVLGPVRPSDMPKAMAHVMAQLMWQGVSSTSLTRS